MVKRIDCTVVKTVFRNNAEISSQTLHSEPESHPSPRTFAASAAGKVSYSTGLNGRVCQIDCYA